MGREPIQDSFTHLEAPKQRKWALRHPEQVKAIKARYEAGEKAKQRRKRYYDKKKALKKG